MSVWWKLKAGVLSASSNAQENRFLKVCRFACSTKAIHQCSQTQLVAIRYCRKLQCQPTTELVRVGGRNWLFYGSDKGGRTGAVLSALIARCKRLSIVPFAYLRDFFSRISVRPHHRLDELVPDKWRFAQRNASSA